MDPQLKKLAGFIISLVGLICFVVIYRYLIDKEWTPQQPPRDEILSIATLLTGMVSGIVATMLGVNPGGGGGGGQYGGSSIRTRIIVMGGFLTPFQKDRPKTWLAAGYLLGYFGTAVYAAVQLATQPNNNIPEIIGSLVLVAFGTIAAGSTSHMNGSNR